MYSMHSIFKSKNIFLLCEDESSFSAVPVPGLDVDFWAGFFGLGSSDSKSASGSSSSKSETNLYKS
mgnify:CR=1 FL=1